MDRPDEIGRPLAPTGQDTPGRLHTTEPLVFSRRTSVVSKSYCLKFTPPDSVQVSLASNSRLAEKVSKLFVTDCGRSRISVKANWLASVTSSEPKSIAGVLRLFRKSYE